MRIQRRGTDDPSGGQWEASAQPRLSRLEQFVDSAPAKKIEFCLGGTTLGASRASMGAPAVAPCLLVMTYNSVSDRGLAYWHRDIHSIDQALLSGLQQDLLANRSSYWQ